MVFRGNMGKNVLFLACRSVFISWGAKHGPKGQKNLHLGSRLIFFSGPRYGKEASPIIFLGFLGCSYAPQTIRSALVSVCGCTEFFLRRHPFLPIFGFRYSETSTRYSFSSTENGLVFLGLKGMPLKDAVFFSEAF